MIDEKGVRRRKRPKRLSIFTDFIIFLILFLVFYSILHIIKNSEKVSFKDDILSIDNLESFDKNNILSEKILEEYGVTVIYGEKSREYIKKVNANIQLDEDEIYSNMQDMYNVFSYYPKEYFKRANLTVVILDSFNGSTVALASRNSLEEYKIYISNAKDYERSLNHEMYHIFEYILNSQKKSIDGWDNLNPEGFAYNSNIYELDDSYVYDEKGSSLENAYFVTKYAKASGKEDRAEVFAEIMDYGIKNQSFLNMEECPIYEKSRVLVNTLKREYNSNNSYKWEIF